MSNVRPIVPEKTARLRKVAANAKYKSWILVGLHDDDSIEVIPDGSVGPFVSTHMLIESLMLIKDQWANEDV